jgi:ribosomal protein L29
MPNHPLSRLDKVHDRLGSMIDQIGQPDYSLRELVDGLREVRDELFTIARSEMAQGSALNGDKGQQNGLLSPTDKPSQSPYSLGYNELAERVVQLERELADLHSKYMGALGRSEAKNDEIAQLRHDLERSMANHNADLNALPSHGGERSMPAMTDTLLSEMIEAWFAEHPVEPYIKREDEPEFFKRVERVYRAVERRMTPSAKAQRNGLADLVIRDVQELPDRTSPDDWPEAMLVTAAELRDIIERHA